MSSRIDFQIPHSVCRDDPFTDLTKQVIPEISIVKCFIVFIIENFGFLFTETSKLVQLTCEKSITVSITVVVFEI